MTNKRQKSIDSKFSNDSLGHGQLVVVQCDSRHRLANTEA